MTNNPQEIIKYCDQSYGDHSILHVFDAGIYQIYLTDFSFVHDGKQYNITLGRKGDHGKYYQITTKEKTYISNNVWYKGEDIKTEYTAVEIDTDKIKKGDIMLNKLDFVADKQKVINHYISTIEKENENDRQEEIDKKEFWSNKQILATFSDDGSQYFFYILKITNKNKNMFHLLVCHEPLLCYMHMIYDDYIQNSSSNITDITNKFIDRINDEMKDLPSPFFVLTASTYIFKEIKKRFPITELSEKKHSDCFGKEKGYEFQIEFESNDDSDS